MNLRQTIFESLPDAEFSTIDVVYMLHPDLRGHNIQEYRPLVFRKLQILEKDG